MKHVLTTPQWGGGNDTSGTGTCESLESLLCTKLCEPCCTALEAALQAVLVWLLSACLSPLVLLDGRLQLCCCLEADMDTRWHSLGNQQANCDDRFDGVSLHVYTLCRAFSSAARSAFAWARRIAHGTSQSCMLERVLQGLWCKRSRVSGIQTLLVLSMLPSWPSVVAVLPWLLRSRARFQLRRPGAALAGAPCS